MAASKENLCNQALSLVGQEDNQITDFDTDTGKNARQCRLHYQSSLESLVRMHTWNCGKKRTTGDNNPVQTVPVITSDEVTDDFTYNQTLNGKAEFLNAASSRSIRWTSSQWEYGTWVDPTFTATFTNAGTDNVPPEDNWVPVVAGTLTLEHDYGFDYTAAYLLPTDCLRPVYFTDLSLTKYYFNYFNRNSYWAVEGRTIMTRYNIANLLYLKEPALSIMDDSFEECFVRWLGSKLAIPIAGYTLGKQIKESVLQEFLGVTLPDAKRINGFEGLEEPSMDSEWMEAILYSGGGTSTPWQALSVGNLPP